MALHALHQCVGIGAIEVGPVRHPADDRIPPGVRHQTVTRRRTYDMHHLIGVDARQRRVAAPDRQGERVASKGTDSQSQLQFVPRISAHLAGEHPFDRLASPQYARFFASRAKHIARRTTGERQRQQDCAGRLLSSVHFASAGDNRGASGALCAY